MEGGYAVSIGLRISNGCGVRRRGTFAVASYVAVDTTVVCPQPKARRGGQFFTGHEIPTTGGEPLRFQSR